MGYTGPCIPLLHSFSDVCCAHTAPKVTTPVSLMFLWQFCYHVVKTFLTCISQWKLWDNLKRFLWEWTARLTCVRWVPTITEKNNLFQPLLSVSQINMQLTCNLINQKQKKTKNSIMAFQDLKLTLIGLLLDTSVFRQPHIASLKVHSTALPAINSTVFITTPVHHSPCPPLTFAVDYDWALILLDPLVNCWIQRLPFLFARKKSVPIMCREKWKLLDRTLFCNVVGNYMWWPFWGVQVSSHYTTMSQFFK